MRALLAIAIAVGCLLAVDAIAQSCTTFYDQNTGRFCSVCVAPGGTPVVNCY